MSVTGTERKAEEKALGARPRVVTDRRAARPRWGEIELYRIVAALLVVAFHVRQSMQVKVWAPERQGLHPGTDYPYQQVAVFEFVMSNVDVIVDFFFVVSGFLLALPWLRSVINATPMPSVRAWTIGRFARVVPLYYLLIIVVWMTRNYGWPGEWRDLVEHLTFTQWADSERIFYTNGPAWSLGVEIWLYPLIPLLLVVAAKPVRRLQGKGARTAALCLAPLLVAVASLVFKLWVHRSTSIRNDQWSFTFGVPAKADLFCIGILLAIGFLAIGTRRLPALAGLGLRLLVLGGLVAAGLARIEWGGLWLVYFHSLVGVLMAVLIAAVVVSRPGRLTRLVNNGLVLRLGALTFALYLGHEPLLVPLEGLGLLGGGESRMLLTWAVFVPVALAFAWLLHTLVETPGIRLRLLWDERGRVREYYPELIVEPTAAPVRARRPEPVRIG